MNVASLQTLLSNHAGFLEEAGAAARLVADLRGLASALSPLAAMPLGDFATLVNQAAEYRATGILPGKNGRKPAVDASAKITAAVTTLRELYDRALDADFAANDVDKALQGIGKLTVPQLKDVARGFEIANVPAKKADIVAALGEKILARREMHQRVSVT